MERSSCSSNCFICCKYQRQFKQKRLIINCVQSQQPLPRAQSKGTAISLSKALSLIKVKIRDDRCRGNQQKPHARFFVVQFYKIVPDSK